MNPCARALLLLLTAALPAATAAQDSFGGSPQQQQPPQNYPQPGPQPQRQTAPRVSLDQLMKQERQNFGVPATRELHSGAPHGPTPTSIPGGQVITTKGLVALVQGRQAPFLLFDVLGGPEMLPNAIPAVAASQPGSFTDQTQTGFGQYLSQTTNGNKQMPLVFYCRSTHCWLSYNAALRAITMGYTNVLWYRGGIDAWTMAGLPLQPAGGQQQR